MIPKLFSQEPALFEPTRLAIVCEVAKESDDEMTFVQLKRSLGLTDGNLNRHLHRLTSDGILVCTREKTAGLRPRTVVRITANGRRRLAAFAEALAAAASHGRRVVGALESIDRGSDPLAEAKFARQSKPEEAPGPRRPSERPPRHGEAGTTGLGGGANIVDERFLGID